MRPQSGGRETDGDMAERTAALVRELVPAGPQPDPETAAGLRADLKNAAATAPDLVLGVMRLAPEAERDTRRRLTSTALVVDRPGWAKVNAQSFSVIGRALEDAAGDTTLAKTGRALSGADGGLTAGVSAAEAAATLSVLAPRVLGQFEPFGDPARLVLVAPTILAVERRLDVVPRDFRLWVALHEGTHQIQFAAAPWLRDHLLGLLVDVTGAAVHDRLSVLDLLRNVIRAVREGGSVLDIVSTPAQLEQLDRVTAVMSVLEGHADIVMDSAGPRVIPTVADIRSRFDSRRGESGGIRGLLGQALGMNEKLQQYARGAQFVRGVVTRVGHEGLAAVWERPENLPTLQELAAPESWVDRVGG